MSFKPFFDYESVTPEMASALQESLKKLRKTEEDLLTAQGDKRKVVCTKRLLKAKDETNDISKSIYEQIHTIPAMIHQAGELKLEQDDDGSFLYIQRCKRCSSKLAVCEDEHENPFEEGDIIAKTSSVVGLKQRRPMRHLYFVGDRKLEKHEMECVSLESIFDN